MAVALAVTAAAFDAGLPARCGAGGRLVCVALPADDAHDASADLRHRPEGHQSSSAPSSAPGRTWPRSSRLHAAGRTRVIGRARKLDEVNESIDDVLAGRVPARIVFEL